MIASSPSPQLRTRRRLASQLLVLMVALSFSSCSFLIDEFTQLNEAGPVSEPQLVAPVGTNASH